MVREILKWRKEVAGVMKREAESGGEYGNGNGYEEVILAAMR